LVGGGVIAVILLLGFRIGKDYTKNKTGEKQPKLPRGIAKPFN